MHQKNAMVRRRLARYEAVATTNRPGQMLEKNVDAGAGTSAQSDGTRGFIFAFLAYFMWGFLPFYMKAVDHVPPSEVVAHRIIWSVPIAGVVLLALGRTGDIKAAFRQPRTLLMAALTAAIISLKDRKSTRLNSSHVKISYAVFC